MQNFKNFLPDADFKKRSASTSYGTYQGFYITVNRATQNAYRVIINASKKDDDYSMLKRFLADFGAARKNVKAIYYENATVVMEVVPSFCKNVFKVMNECVPDVVAYLKKEMYTTGCEICGDEFVESYTINGTSHFICSNCSNEIVQAFEANKQQKQNEKSKVIPGIIGALLGSLLGVLCWVIIFKLGYIAAISGIIMVICAAKGYELLGGNVDIKGIVIVCVISLIMIYFANQIGWTWEAYDALSESRANLSFFDVYRNLMDLIRYSDCTREFYGDLAMGYFFAVVGAASTVISYVRAAKANYKVVKNQQ